MQQINLYTDAFKPKKVILPLAHLIALPILMAGILLLISLLLESSLGTQQTEIAEIEAKNQALQQRVDQLETRASKMRKDDALVAANQRLSQRLIARQDMMDILDTVVVRDDEGFSATLISLARQNLDSLWLQRILISASGKQLRLEGTTKNSDAVPQYLQKLRQEQSFIGRTFNGFELNVNESQKQLMDFVLYTAGASDEKNLADMKTGSDIVKFSAEKAEALQ